MKNKLFDSILFFQNVGTNPELAAKADKQQIISYLDMIVETFVERSLFSIFIYDTAKKRNIWVNEGYLENGKYTLTDVLSRGQGFLDSVLHPDDFAVIHEAFVTKSPADGIFRTHCRKLNGEGKWDWLYLMAIQLPEKKGNANLFLGFSTNLSKDGFIVDHWDKIATENARLRHKVAILLLTRREKEVLLLFASGLAQKEIGHRLGISFNTVETHKRNIFKKLGKNSISGIVAFAVEAGMN
jgi:DNA-binding CsgD family transcriptional regulator